MFCISGSSLNGYVEYAVICETVPLKNRGGTVGL